MSSKKRESWGSAIGVILAVTGSAVGVGNFLRFPGLAAKYDGGAFLIPYFLALLFLGLPIAWSEWAMGRMGGQHGFNSCPGIFRSLWKNRLAPYFGVLGLIVPVIIYMYYLWIESWCLGYAWKFLTGQLNLGTDPASYSTHFSTFVGISADGSFLTHGFSLPVLCLLACIVINFFFIYRGLSGGIEKVCLWGMPLLILCALLVLTRVLTLGTPDPSHPERNVLSGLAYMWDIRGGLSGLHHSLQNAEMWMAAASQIFFSLSVGFGVIINYSSYLKKKDDIALSATTAVAGNEFCEVSLGGLITIPAAFIFLGVAGTSGGTFGLGFQTLPLVFAHMPGGQLFGFLWFFLLFIAALTSSLSMLQPAIAFMEEGLDLDRRGSVTLLGFVTLMGTGLVIWFTQDLAALDAMDFWIGSFSIFLLATIQTLIYGWVLGPRRGREELERGALLPIPRMFDFVIRYISPVYLLSVFGLWIHQKGAESVTAIQTNPAVRITLLFIISVIIFFLLLIARAVRVWHARESKSI